MGVALIISVLERRAEIGLRRSLDATQGQIRLQFLSRVAAAVSTRRRRGALLGIAVTALYATSRSWPPVVPVWVPAGGVALTLVTGAVAGLYPAIRAARLAPTEALTAP
ncbi:ABC transporter permease [Dactylosporangium sp. NPDC049525]|uniref:ABC transporter permease n=1 Tax=Dactylosporangium sp. NPDC049525 TaxID=3154730 RepID=UPI003436A906